MIPKVIYLIWFGNNNIPNKCKIAIDSWKKYLSDYEIIVINEENYDVNKCIFTKDCYEKNNLHFYQIM